MKPLETRFPIDTKIGNTDYHFLVVDGEGRLWRIDIDRATGRLVTEENEKEAN